MASEKVTLYRTNEDETEVIEQLPKTVASQVYDAENEQFLDRTVEGLNVHTKNESSKKHIEVVSSVPTDLTEAGIFIKVDGTQSDVPSMITVDHLNDRVAQVEQLASDQVIPSYWESHLNSQISRIRQLQDEDGTNRFSIGFITDMHLDGNNDKQSGKLMNKIDDEIHLPFIINGGDCVSHYQGAIPKANAIRQIREMFNMFSPRIRDKMLYMVANHDDNSHSNQVWSETLKEGELYSQFFRYLDNKVVRGESPRYYYADDNFHKIRLIVLDCNDVPYIQENNRAKYPISAHHPFRQAQLNWFANVALNVPNATWQVIVTSHAPPFSAGVDGFDRPVVNGDLALGILAAFRNKTTYTGSSASTVIADFLATVSADFTGKGGEVICWITGDTHRDNVVTLAPYADIKLVTTLNDHKNRDSSGLRGTSGTITEQAFDIMTIDRANKKVYLTRIGAGTDRQFSYAPIVPEQIIFEDNFTRANSSSLGSNWLAQRGEFRIENNVARPRHTTGTSISLYNGSVPQNIIIESILQPHTNLNTGVGIAMRYVDDENFVRVMIENFQLLLVLVENDVKTPLAQKSISYTGTESFTVRVEVVNNEFKVFLDDMLELTGSTSKFMDTTRCGIRSWTQIDDSPRIHSFSIKGN